MFCKGQIFGSVENKRPLREIALRFMVKICFGKQTIEKESNMGITPQKKGITIGFDCQFEVQLMSRQNENVWFSAK
jgi:hypothetical protein